MSVTDDSTTTVAPTREITDLSTADAERIRRHEDLVWFETHPGLTADDYVETLDWSRTRAALFTGEERTGRVGEPEENEPLAGLYSAWLMGVTVPGPLGSLAHLPMDGLTWVGVHPDLRRRGVLRAMMTDHLHRVKERGEAAVAGLHASETAIYGRYGYGPATLQVQATLGRGAELTAPPEVEEAARRVSLHLATVDTPAGRAAVHAAHTRTAARTLGAVARGEDVVATWFHDFPKSRGRKEPLRVLLAQVDGQLTGYAVLRRESKWSDTDLPEGTVQVRELAAEDAGTLLALGRRLVDFDLTAKVTLWDRSLDDPLLWWAGGHRSTQTRVGDSLWLRLVDLPRALTERGYATGCDVVLDVSDAVCPWNAGRWRLTAGPDGTGRCEPTDADPEVRLDVNVLGAAYAGDRPVAAQAAAGWVTELRSGAVGELSRALRADTGPYSAIGF